MSEIAFILRTLPQSWMKLQDRILTVRAAATGFILLFLLAMIRYFKVEIIAKSSFDKYTMLELTCMVLVMLAGIVWLRKPQTYTKPSLISLTAQNGMDRRDKYDPLLTLRGFACLCVFLGHCVLITYPPAGLSDAIKQNAFYVHFLPEPWMGVWIFFTLSGYLMGKGFFSGRYNTTMQSIFSFYRNRFLRILPMYFVATLLIAVLIEPDFFRINNIANALNLLVMFDFAADPTIPIGALWSIGTELEFYLFVPFLFVLIRNFLTNKRNISVMFSTVLVCGYLLRHWVMYHLPGKVYAGPFLGNFDFFLCGMILSALLPHLQKMSWLRHRIAISLVVLVICYLIAAYYCQHGRLLAEPHAVLVWQVYLPSVTILFTSAIIVLMETATFAQETGLVRFIIKHMQMLGVLTYALYVWHAPIILADHQSLNGEQLSLLHSLGLTIFSLLKSLVVAYAFYCWVERYYDNKKVVYLDRALLQEKLEEAELKVGS